MKNKLLILSFTLISAILCSQSQPMAFENWKTTAGTQNFFYKNVTKTDKLGNIYVAGATLNALGNTDILLAKYNPSGIQLWIQQYAGAGNGVDFAAGLAVTDAYAYLTGAVTNNTATAETDIITMKYSASGVLQWASTYNGSGNFLDVGKHIVVDASGNVFITGASYNASSNTDFVSIRYNASGTQQWASTFDYLGADDAAIKIAIAGSNLTVTGAVTSAPSSYKFATLTLAQSTGSVTATNISSAVTTTSVDAVTDFTNDVLGNIIIVGSTYVAGQGENYYVQKMNSSLGTAWTYTFNGTSSLNDVAKGVQADASGNIYITGYSTSSTQGRNITTIKLNSSGVNQWAVHYNDTINGDDEASDMIIDPAGNIYVTGYNTNTLNKTDYYTIKYNSSGTKIWHVISDGTSLNDIATNIALDTLNNVIVTGQSQTAPTDFKFLTVKYIQLDVIIPIDFNNVNEPYAKNSLFYANSSQILKNSGSVATEVKFYSTNTYPQLYFQNSSLSFLTRQRDSTSGSLVDSTDRIDLKFLGGNLLAKTYSIDKQSDGYLNFFKPNTGGANGLTNLQGATRLMIPNIYPNIDLHYYSNKDGLKLYFIVKPGANPKQIVLAFSGNITTSLNSNNELNILSSLTNFDFKKPKIYNVTMSLTTPTIGGTISNISANNYIFNVNTYNTAIPLIIELEQKSSIAVPLSTCDWSTFYGGSGWENVNKVITDAIGNSFFVGETDSPTFPNLVGGYLTTVTGRDGYIIKLKPNGSQAWGTYFSGNSAGTNISSIALNSVGEIWVCGSTGDAALPIVPLASSTFAGATDAFTAKFNSSGNILLSSRFYGSSSTDEAVSIAVDATNNIYIGGNTGSSSGLPMATIGGYNQIASGGGISDGFIAKFSPSNVLIWSSYFGGSLSDYVNSLKIMQNGNIIISGNTTSASRASDNLSNPICDVPTVVGDFPDCKGGGLYYNQSFGGGFQDNFIAEFNPSASMIWSSYYGGAGTENEARIVLGQNANEFYLIGNSNKNSNSLSTGPIGSYIQNPSLFGVRGYIAKFVSRQPVWFTFLGDGTNTFATDGVLDGNGIIYVTGHAVTTSYSSLLCQPVPVGSTSTDFPKCFPPSIFNQPTYGGGSAGDAFIMAFNPSNHMLWSTFYGSGSLDDGKSLAFDQASNKLVFTGNTQSGSGGFPLFDPSVGNYQQNINAGGTNNRDCFFAKLCLTTIVGIKEYESTNNDFLTAYPNPNTGDFTINLTSTNSSSFTYQLIDVLGKVLESGCKEIIEQTMHFNFSNKNYKTGLYFLKLNTNNSQSIIKFIKE